MVVLRARILQRRLHDFPSNCNSLIQTGMLRRWSVAALILFTVPYLVHAQNASEVEDVAVDSTITGKIAGSVTDSTTGEPLAGASILLIDTFMGAASDLDGNYHIIGVPVGIYDVQVSFYKYRAKTATGVEVDSSYTRMLNVALGPAEEKDEVIIEYERPLIQSQGCVGITPGEAGIKPKKTETENCRNMEET